MTNIAMEIWPVEIDDVPSKSSIDRGFSMAMLNNQMVDASGVSIINHGVAILRSGGKDSRCFMMENPILKWMKWMMTGGTLISGNLHIGHFGALRCPTSGHDQVATAGFFHGCGVLSKRCLWDCERGVFLTQILSMECILSMHMYDTQYVYM